MKITSRQAPEWAVPSGHGDGIRRYRLHMSEPGGPDEGEVVLAELAPGSEYTVATPGPESGSILLDGAGELVVDGVVRAVDEGAIVQTQGEVRYLLRAGHRPATLLSIYGHGDISDQSSGVRVSRLDDVADTAVHNPERGFLHMSARMLVDLANGGSGAFTLGQSTFAPGGGRHALHRHPYAAELFYVWSGEGAHLSEDGTEYPMRGGDLVYVPRNEWHGFRNCGPVPVRAVFGYLGVNTRERAGYELPDHPVSRAKD